MDDRFLKPKFWTVKNTKISTWKYITVCSEIRFSKILYYIEISNLTCFENQLTGFYMVLYGTSFYWKVFTNRLVLSHKTLITKV